MKTTLMCFAGLFLALQVFAANPGTEGGMRILDESSRREFADFYRQSLQENGVVGSSFLLVHDNAIVTQEFYGLSDLEKRQPVDSETIFHWASITKTFTGIAIMQLRDRGLLGLDDPIVKYLPELRQVHDAYGDISDITIRQLMSHSSGFRDPTWPWREHDWQPFEPARWEQLVAMFPYTEILFKPGSRYGYSNLGVIFLGRVIEQLSGDPFQSYIDKNILKPLQMYQTYFDRTPYHLIRHRSHGYYIKDAHLSESIFDVNTGITVSNGGLNSPMSDMAKYMAFLIGQATDARTRETYNGILKRSTLEEMFGPQIKIESPDFSQGEPNRRDWVGLSFFVEESSGRRLICHSGSQNGFHSHLYLDPKSKTAYLVAFNTDAEATENDHRDTRRLDLTLKQHVLKGLFKSFD